MSFEKREGKIEFISRGTQFSVINKISPLVDTKSLILKQNLFKFMIMAINFYRLLANVNKVDFEI